MASFCKQWWHVPAYITISIMLAFAAISTALHSHSKNVTTVTKPIITHDLSLRASRTLRRAGFNTAATLLQVFPELFLSSPNSTIFAIKDSAISNASLPSWLLKDLLQYHTSPSKLSMKVLLKKPQGSCFPTLHPRKNIAITKIDVRQKLVEINHVLISHPDVFLEGSLAVHGVLGPFSPLDPLDVQEGLEFLRSPICDSNSTLVSDVLESEDMVEWSRIIQLLSSNGFISFAIGLHSVLDGILEDYQGLNSVTIFVPPSLEVVASPSPLLERIVRFHILPRRLTYKELSSLPGRTLLRTLVSDQDLEVTAGGKFLQELIVNGEKIAAPDIFSSKKFVIHGISRAFEIAKLPNTSI